MKATLEFELPEDMEKMQAATMASEMLSVLYAVDNLLRNTLKYREEHHYNKAMEESRTLINEMIGKLL